MRQPCACSIGALTTAGGTDRSVGARYWPFTDSAPHGVSLAVKPATTCCPQDRRPRRTRLSFGYFSLARQRKSNKKRGKGASPLGLILLI